MILVTTNLYFIKRASLVLNKSKSNNPPNHHKGRDELEIKQDQFIDAMSRYHATPNYERFNLTISITNVSLQAYLLAHLPFSSLSLGWHLIAFFCSFVIADFINGLVHLYMDNNDNYESLAGPLIAAFHLHHVKLRYTENPVLKVYFNESGYKIWLVPYLLVTAALLQTNILSGMTLSILIYVGVLSSISEVSHFLCHNSKSPFVRQLQNMRILLSPKHHARHHTEDNVNYAFLNGMTDPAINLLAKVFYKGYKEGTDLHINKYQLLNNQNH